MTATQQPYIASPACEPWGGLPERYQQAAHESMDDVGHRLLPWAWVTPTCGTHFCLLASHLVAHSPKTIAYPAGICVYCGAAAFTKDHLLPRGWTGDAQRRWVATVPACGQCNSSINDAGVFSISKRREIAHAHLERKYRRALNRRDFTPLELRQMGHILKSSVRAGLAEREEVMRRLRWPEDFDYDERAFQKSGIADPAALGLL